MTMWFASPSNRWSDPPARLLDGKRWEAVAENVLHGLGLDEPVGEHLAGGCAPWMRPGS